MAENIAPEDFFDEESEQPPVEPQQLRGLVDELVTLEGEIAAQKIHVAELNSRASELRSMVIPDLLREMGTEVWRDDLTGYGVSLELAVNSALPQDPAKKQAILDKLSPLGVNEIMNDSLLFQFKPGDGRINQLISFAEGEDLPGVRSMSVHGARFKAWLKEKINTGFGAAVSEAGIWHGRHVRLVKPKGKK